MGDFFQFDWSFLENVGNDPFQAMWFFFANGGWFLVLAACIWGATHLWKDWRQHLFNSKKTWILLSIHVPRTHEQTPRAIENMFAYFCGAHSENNFVEEWFLGRTQDTMTFEIVSINGHVQYYIWTTPALRNLVEAGIYSQYPDTDIFEVEDYVSKVPQHYPDEEWDVWGSEFKLTRPDFYPIKTYSEFEDKVSGEFKDPHAAMLEALSRLELGEQAWFQIVITPIGQSEFHKKSETLVKKLTGQKVEVKQSFVEQATNFPMAALGVVGDAVIGRDEHAKPIKQENPLMSKMLHMTQSEKDIVEAIENKASKIVYKCKMRFIYVAKKETMSLSHVVQGFFGSIRQFNLNNMNSLKPDFKKVGVASALWWFKARRNNGRKTRLIRAYRKRSNWAGLAKFHLSSEELATLWHFPLTLLSNPPQLKKTETKKSQPPANIPFG